MVVQLFKIHISEAIMNETKESFAFVPEFISSSSLDVPSIHADISTQEIVQIIREGRERGILHHLDREE
ncbi:MAG: hypothetical protein C4527_16720 [Candidatus Omnitrophota bacterium]|jgi:hypothetical protein|nr:MAG: hypothetical protein C4527_16720 [Candidatus Omnitrophota bacterium]